jgi:hypothetical protein
MKNVCFVDKFDIGVSITKSSAKTNHNNNNIATSLDNSITTSTKTACGDLPSVEEDEMEQEEMVCC